MMNLTLITSPASTDMAPNIMTAHCFQKELPNDHRRTSAMTHSHESPEWASNTAKFRWAPGFSATRSFSEILASCWMRRLMSIPEI
jgi:hypothetical protein